ncbi:hypothetical protein [Tranquillimonas rosea]|uniref:hypothetical protein n=1 Tax=Tranquillimonas rosea TaxID=641238 RepID=UPI003BADBC7A
MPRRHETQPGPAIHLADRADETGVSDAVPPEDGPRFAGAAQPARRALGIAAVEVAGAQVPVVTTDLFADPFSTLVELRCDDGVPRPTMLVVPPLSGQFSILMRDVLVGLLPDFRVGLIDWTNVRHVPADRGGFGFGSNIRAIEEAADLLGEGLSVLALCQGGVPALAAVARLEARGAGPATLSLMAAPVDPLANPTRLVRLLRRLPAMWYRTVPLTRVPKRYAGHGRLVYPAEMQLMALRTYLGRHRTQDGEITRKLTHDDGAAPGEFPFLDLYASVMDLDALNYSENISRVFLERGIVTGRLTCDDEPIVPAEIRDCALFTIEGADDDVAAPGQTAAAHAVCTALPESKRAHLTVPGCGHFSLFHGDIWRRSILPEVRAHCARHR